jgi:hypothetical protein
LELESALHMNEVVSGNGSFSDARGWSDQKREQLVRDCLFYSQTIDKQSFRTFICSLDMERYRELNCSTQNFPSVSTLCNRWVPFQIFKWYLENFGTWKLAELYYFFAQNERYMGPFNTIVRRRQKKSRRGLYNHWDIIKQITSSNMRLTLPLQLADLLAWAHHRKLTPHSEGLKWSYLHTMTDAVLPFTRKDITVGDLNHIKNWLSFGNVVKEYFSDLTFPSEDD